MKINGPLLDRLHKLKIKAIEEIQSSVGRIVPEAKDPEIVQGARQRYVDCMELLQRTEVQAQRDPSVWSEDHKERLVAKITGQGVTEATAKELVEGFSSL